MTGLVAPVRRKIQPSGSTKFRSQKTINIKNSPRNEYPLDIRARDGFSALVISQRLFQNPGVSCFRRVLCSPDRCQYTRSQCRTHFKNRLDSAKIVIAFASHRFSRVESGDMLPSGTPRASCGQQLIFYYCHGVFRADMALS